MERVKMQRFSKRMGEEAKASETSLSKQELVTTVRRLGYICIKMHEIVMGRLTTQGEHELAERFNDVFKPLADLLVHFELEEHLESEENQDGV